MEGKRSPDARCAWGRRGQSSVEYVLVMLAFVSMVLAMGVVWHAGRDGTLLRAALDAASHRLGGSGVLGGFQDILLY